MKRSQIVRQNKLFDCGPLECLFMRDKNQIIRGRKSYNLKEPFDD